MTEVSPEPESSLLSEDSQMVRLAGPVFLLLSLVLIPWTIYLGVSLPSRQLLPHYNVAWAEFDVLELIASGPPGTWPCGAHATSPSARPRQPPCSWSTPGSTS